MRTSLLCLLGAFVLLLPVLAADEDACEMKSVVKARYCLDEESLLENADVVSEVTYYECEECGMVAAKAGACPDCEGEPPLVEQVSRALIVFACPECGETSLEPGKCADEDCDAHGKPMEKRCSASGSAPHVR